MLMDDSDEKDEMEEDEDDDDDDDSDDVLLLTYLSSWHSYVLRSLLLYELVHSFFLHIDNKI